MRRGLRRDVVTEAGRSESSLGQFDDARDRQGQLAAAVVAAMPAAVLVVDHEGRTHLSNPMARQLEIVRGGYVEHPDVLALIAATLRSGTSQQGDVLHTVGRSAEPRSMSVTAAPLSAADGFGDQRAVRGLVGVVLVDNTAAHRLDATRRDFVANVSHELKTPVGALSLLAETLADAADDPSAVARFAGRIKHESVRLAALVNDLIELSRLQGADPAADVAAVPVRRISDEVIDRVRLAAEAVGIEIVAGGALDEAVVVNERQLVTAIGNLVDNAIAYSPANTRIAIGATVSSDGHDVDIAVSDQGVGIAEVDQERVFERFYRVDPARSRATGGTGLGLAIVKHIVSNHGGSISLWSAPGTGSTFTVRLPRAEASQASSNEAFTQEGAG